MPSGTGGTLLLRDRAKVPCGIHEGGTPLAGGMPRRLFNNFRNVVSSRHGQDGMVAGDLARALGVPANNLSFHLKTMREAGLLSVQAEGRYQRYRANIAHMLRLLAFVTDNCCYKAEPSRNKREHLPVVPAPLAQVRRNTSTAKGSRRNHQKGEPK
jgi:DNA-binding transcriptional ArsR family regulator